MKKDDGDDDDDDDDDDVKKLHCVAKNCIILFLQ